MGTWEHRKKGEMHSFFFSSVLGSRCVWNFLLEASRSQMDFPCPFCILLFFFTVVSLTLFSFFFFLELHVLLRCPCVGQDKSAFVFAVLDDLRYSRKQALSACLRILTYFID